MISFLKERRGKGTLFFFFFFFFPYFPHPSTQHWLVCWKGHADYCWRPLTSVDMQVLKVPNKWKKIKTLLVKNPHGRRNLHQYIMLQKQHLHDYESWWFEEMNLYKKLLCGLSSETCWVMYAKWLDSSPLFLSSSGIAPFYVNKESNDINNTNGENPQV